jgi:antitoxin (DNA-binding transcriptional repressor) of toxin-antitoxin stability system
MSLSRSNDESKRTRRRERNELAGNRSTSRVQRRCCFPATVSLQRVDGMRSRDARRPPVHVGVWENDKKEMCHNVHMKTISIRELHLKTGRWVRHAASRGAIVVTDRGRRVAALQPFDASVTGRPLPNREAAIRKRSKVPVDSAVYQSELREDR